MRTAFLKWNERKSFIFATQEMPKHPDWQDTLKSKIPFYPDFKPFSESWQYWHIAKYQAHNWQIQTREHPVLYGDGDFTHLL